MSPRAYEKILERCDGENVLPTYRCTLGVDDSQQRACKRQTYPCQCRYGIYYFTCEIGEELLDGKRK